MLEEKDIDLIYKICDSRYRKADDCNEIMSQSDKRQDKMEKAFVESKTMLKVVIAILSFIATALTPVGIKILFGG